MRDFAGACAWLLALVSAGTALAAPANLSLARAPLYLASRVSANIMLTLDDSGSMAWDYMPDYISGAPNNSNAPREYSSVCRRHYLPNGGAGAAQIFGLSAGAMTTSTLCDPGDPPFSSVQVNRIYYNPELTYVPGVDASGTDLPSQSRVNTASWTRVQADPYLSPATTVNLVGQFPEAVYCDTSDRLATDTTHCKRNGIDAGGYTYPDNTKGSGVPSASPVNHYAAFGTAVTSNPKAGTYVYKQTLSGPPYYYTAASVEFCATSADAFAAYPTTCQTKYDSTHTYARYGTFARTNIVASRTAYPKALSRTDCADATCTYDEEMTNFANWYAYYRTRMLVAKTGISRAFALAFPDPDSSARVGFGRINKALTNIDGIDTQTLVTGVRPFAGTTAGGNRYNFFSNLFGTVSAGGTPLRRALEDVGRYFERTDDRGPWAENPGIGGGSASACRQSFNILMSDGYWNSGGAAGAAAANVDNATLPEIANHRIPAMPPSYRYTPANPYKDNYADTLADIAMYYWGRDLYPGLPNQVVSSPSDPAFWQHLVNFTIGLGLDGTLDTASVKQQLANASVVPWPEPGPDKEENLDDLWHAAVNSHGSFFSVTDTSNFAVALANVLNAIQDRESSAAAVALDAGVVGAGDFVYQAKFDSGTWNGDLVAWPIKADGSLGAPAWRASTWLDSHTANERKIVTYKRSTGSGIPFRWSAGYPSVSGGTELDGANQADALFSGDGRGDARLAYLRGTHASGFRVRASKLGDIVSSAPAYVGAPKAHYPLSYGIAAPETSYAAFKAANANRAPMLYVGANDAMLHAFDPRNNGAERFAYIPGVLFKDLKALTDPVYAHRYYADGSPIVRDVYFRGAWHTVLVAGLNGGGQGLYALDITVPPKPDATEADLAAKVLWEFSDDPTPVNGYQRGHADLGYTFSEPNLVRMQNGKWAAVFGNGYNNTVVDAHTSSTGNALLLVVDVQTGALIKALDTGTGAADDPLGSNRPNGLSTPAPIDANGDGIVDYVFAGDLFGNLWKFDVSDPDPAKWNIAYAAPVFQACAGEVCTRGAKSNYQPITSRPEVGAHPAYPNSFLVYFGTGKYMEPADNSANGQTTQTFYAIWDKNQFPQATIARTGLLQQSITQELSQTYTDAESGTSVNYEVRTTTDSEINWSKHSGWYMDLYNGGGGNTRNFGERQISGSTLRNGKIIFTTLVPAQDVCDALGGTSWLMELDSNSGAQLGYAPFDLNNDKRFSKSDYVATNGDSNAKSVTVPPSGMKSKVGIMGRPGIGSSAGNDDIEQIYGSGSTGLVQSIRQYAGPRYIGRTSWRELLR